MLRTCASILLVFGALAGSGTAAADGIRQQEWPLDTGHFNASAIWRITRGEGVTVAVVDSGVDSGHPDLSGRVLPGSGFVGARGDKGLTDISSDSHGTAIAAIIAGTGKANGGSGMIGLAPGAKILPVRVATQGQVEPGALAEGIKYAADHGARVINISLTTGDPDPVLRQAVDYAMARDCVVVAAAGNEGADGDPTLYPAAFPGVIAVSGTDEQNDFWPVSESGPRIALAAPATDIYSANNHGQYVNANGTSYAAAYVSAAAALVRSATPHLTAAQTVERLITTADAPSEHTKGSADEYGYGILDPLAALRSHVTVTRATRNPLLAARPVQAASSDRTAVVAWAVGAAVVASGWGTFAVIRARRKNKATSARKPRQPAGRAGRRPTVGTSAKRADRQPPARAQAKKTKPRTRKRG